MAGSSLESNLYSETCKSQLISSNNLKEQLISQSFLSDGDESSYGINSDQISAFDDLPEHVVHKTQSRQQRRPSALYKTRAEMQTLSYSKSLMVSNFQQINLPNIKEESCEKTDDSIVQESATSRQNFSSEMIIDFKTKFSKQKQTNN